MYNILKNKKAFSLIELSIVLIIIALLVIGVIGGQRLITLGKISTAKTGTKSSPVTSVKGIAIWLETVMEESINENDAEEGAALTSWRDLNPQSGEKYSTTLSGLTYRSDLAAQTINRIPSIDFTDENDYIRVEDNFILNPAMTMFVVGKFPQSNFLISLEDKTISGDGFIFSTANDPVTPGPVISITRSVGATQTTISSADLTSWFGDIEAIASVRYDGTNISYQKNREGWINLAASLTDKKAATGTLRIGDSGSSGGYLGEVLIFDRSITDNEAALILEYLVTKWVIKEQ